MATRGNDSEAISGGRSPPNNQTGKTNAAQASGSTTHQTISTQVNGGAKYRSRCAF